MPAPAIDLPLGNPVTIRSLTTTAAATVFVLLAASCGSSTVSTSAVVYRDAEQVSIKPENIVHPTTSAPVATTTQAGGNESASAPVGQDASQSAASTTTVPATTTIPLNADNSDPIDGVFSAMKVFNGCLKDKGTSFIGIPVAGGDPQDPVNDSQYISDLVECAAVSQIQGAFESLQSASDNIPADEIEGRNRGLVKWADCLKGRGWKLGELKPDARGLLQIPQELQPPSGQSILESDDMQECRDIAAAELEAETQ